MSNAKRPVAYAEGDKKGIEMKFETKSGRLASTARGLAVASLAGATMMIAGGAVADPMATPSMTAPLSANPNPFSVDTGTPLLGKVYIGGAVTGMVMTQDNRLPSDKASYVDLTNAQVIIQTTTGPIQFYVQAGAYSQPFLAVPYMKSSDATTKNFGAVPIAYAKVQVTPEISLLAGKLYPLIGNEYTFTFQNMNVFRGLLVAQEPAVSQGFQATYAKGPLTASVSFNDGFYSNRLSWVSGSLAYAATSKDTFTVSGGGAVSKSGKSSFTTPPAQNNGWIVNAIYAHTDGPLYISPYFQYTKTPERDEFGVTRAGYTWGGAVLAKYSLTPQFSLAGRIEYEKTHSDECPVASPTCVPVNYLFGPDSHAWSFTVTPTWQKGIFFVRGEGSYVLGGNVTPGSGFGDVGEAKNQFRLLAETGVLF